MASLSAFAPLTKYQNEEEMAIELARPGLIQITDNEYPSVFTTVTEWRKNL